MVLLRGITTQKSTAKSVTWAKRSEQGWDRGNSTGGLLFGWAGPGMWDTTLLAGKECSAGQLSCVFGQSVYNCNDNGVSQWWDTSPLYCRYNKPGLRPRQELILAIISEKLWSYWKSIAWGSFRSLAAKAQHTQQETGCNLQDRNILTQGVCRFQQTSGPREHCRY